jgi:hypothetical protein
MHLSFYCIHSCLLALLIWRGHANYQKNPIKVNELSSNRVMRRIATGVASAGALAALYAAKTGPIDGPLFTENVDLTGKDVLITGGK